MFNFKNKTSIKLCIYQCVYKNIICISLGILHNLYIYTIRLYYSYNQ